MGKHIRVCSVLAIVAVACMVTLALFFVLAGAQAASTAPLRAGKGMPRLRSSLPEGVDLDVTYISRTPLYQAYCVEYLNDAPNQPGRPILCPGTEDDRRWPEPGEMVAFVAHIINKGTLTSPPFSYAWHLDGVQVAGGTLPALAASEEVTATLQWPWPHGLSDDGQRALGEHTVRFTADPTDAIAETYETNNSLQDRTNAMSFSIYFSPEMYEAYNVPVSDTWPHSAEDWMQKQIATMNANFANAVYPVTPEGSSLRVRINTIAVAPTNPGPDGQHDGGWWIQDEVRCEGCGYYDPATDIDWGMIHELSHQVSIIDLYATGVCAANVFATAQDGMPANVGADWANGGLMGGGDISPYTDHTRYSSHTAGGASTYAGYRNGYYGSYLFDIPLDNSLRILDSQGNPAPDVQVALYQRTGPWDWTGHLGVDAIPEIGGVTDGSGMLALPNRSANGGTVTANGHVMHDNPFGVVDIIGNQGLFLIQLVRDGHEEFHWLDITEFNLAYWRGDVLSHTFLISSHVPPPGAPLAPEVTAVRVEGTWASLDWQPSPSPGVVGYRVYRAAAPRYEHVAAGGLLTGTHFEEFGDGLGDGQHRLYAVTAVDGAGRESGFGERVYAPGLGGPVAIASAPDGSRTVLNNWNFYPLLRQRQDGRYTRRLVNVWYDLGNAHFLAYDPAGRLLVSGFGEFPKGRPAVRIYDQEFRPVWGFGDEGSDLGQVRGPAGVAWWGPACTYGGPYAVDEHTLLLLHFDGDYAGAQGEEGAANGTTFASGVFGLGVLIDVTDTLTYTTENNLELHAGTIEFWVRPNFDSAGAGVHTLFETEDPWGVGGIQIAMGGGTLGWLIWAGENLSGVHSAVDWRAGEWHHVAAAWQEQEMWLALDGRLVDSYDGVVLPTTLGPAFRVGSTPNLGWQVDGVIDELRISDAPRVGNNDLCGRILVADSALGRIQAFDDEGNLVSTYGSPGSGAGQFSNPQGLAVDRNGQVIVADQGNNRLVVLAFNGAEFGYLGSYSPGLSAPSGVVVDTWGHIVVADTANNRVVVLDPQGSFLADYTQPNDDYTGPFNAPRGVAVDFDGDLVVADTGNRRVVTVHGALPGQWGTWLPFVSRR